MSRRPFAPLRTLAFLAVLALCVSVIAGVGFYIAAIYQLDGMLNP